MRHAIDENKYREGSFGPRRFGEHKLHENLSVLTDPDLWAGDILIAKEWSPHNAESFFIPLAQSVFSHHTAASAASDHVLLVVKDGAAKTAQAVARGVLISKGINKRDHVVYSCTDEDLRWEAVHVAERLGGVSAGKRNEGLVARGESPVKFRGSVGMTSVLLRRKKLGSGGSDRLRLIFDYVYKRGELGDVRMVCSEFVTTCYEVAAMRLSEATQEDVKAFNVDPRAISAKALESLLRDSATPFRLAGRYRGTINYTSSQIRQAKREAQQAHNDARQGVQTYDQNNIPEAVRRARRGGGG